jgi:hypothetical protein
MEQPSMQYLHCPLQPCHWRTVDRSHLTTVVMVDGADENGLPHLVTRDAAKVVQTELREHLATDHRRELQLMLAGIDADQAGLQVCSIVQHVDARQVQDAADLVATVLVPQMRARLAKDMASKGLRPLDPWPAVIVRRYVWTSDEQWMDAMHAGHNPPGMRELQDGEREDGRQPDLYALELHTEAIPDTRTVDL